MAANGKTNSTETTEPTEVTEVAEEQVQILFKVPESQRDALKVVALLEKRGGLQGLFAHVANDLVAKHQAKLDELFSDTAA